MKKTLFILLTVTAVIAFGSISVFAAGYGYGYGYSGNKKSSDHRKS